MLIQLEGVGKRFIKNWIFRNIHLTFQDNHRYAIVGRNGSGKSTLLQLIAGLNYPTEGRIIFSDQNGKLISADDIPLRSSFTAPYQELPEELTAIEIYNFHYNFRKKTNTFDSSEFFEAIQLGAEQKKQVKYFSSGMKQRLKLGLGLFTDSDIYFLDEPTTNLDRSGIEWYNQLLSKQVKNKPIFISSNIEEEYQQCDTIIQISDFI